MPDKEPRLRGNSGARRGPWSIGDIPDGVIYAIGKQLVHHLAIGTTDIKGDDFGDMLAGAVGGTHLSSPLGLADVVHNTTGWSVKTVKASTPAKAERVRLISGRNSPDYSFDINNPRTDIQATGNAVLSIWNSRLNGARDKYEDMRVMVLVRNMETREFLLFEEEMARYVANDYVWSVNQRGNLEGHRKSDGKHCFTWQPHGAQFTVIRDVPGSARPFKINHEVPLVDQQRILSAIQYDQSWIEIS